jgi:creatinine amidohydrolase/Fe(II)-dependent formamide hydrolase-like protein
MKLLGETLYEVRGPKTLFEMSWPEVEEALGKTDVVIVPVGSTEQHGTHLPLGSDTLQAGDMARMVRGCRASSRRRPLTSSILVPCKLVGSAR